MFNTKNNTLYNQFSESAETHTDALQPWKWPFSYRNTGSPNSIAMPEFQPEANDKKFLGGRPPALRSLTRDTARVTQVTSAIIKTTNRNINRTRSSADADNRLDAFSGQSRSTNMVPFHMLHIVSYCAIVTLSLRQIYDIRLQKIS